MVEYTPKQEQFGWTHAKAATNLLRGVWGTEPPAKFRRGQSHSARTYPIH